MTRIQQLFSEQGQSPWLDNLTRAHLRNGRLQQLVDDGLRGVTDNPTIFQKAVAGSSDYDEDFQQLVAHWPPTDTTSRDFVTGAYWDLITADVEAALRVLRPLHEDSGGGDGFVSLELEPTIAHETEASVAAARELHRRIDASNLLVKIPGTAEGVPAVRQMIGEVRSINITLLFALERYAEVIDAYFQGLEAYAATGGDLSRVHSVASFFLSRVDTEVDRRLEAIGSPEALRLRGRTAVAQAKLAYRLFRQRFSGQRWDALATAGARLQRPLWASTSTKNSAYPDTLYVNGLIGPDSVNTMPDSTLTAFEDHGAVNRTIDVGVDEAEETLDELARLGIDLVDVARVLEDEVAAFAKSFSELLDALEAKAASQGHA